MSPLPLRRYRAERVLRKEFEGQRARVLGVVGGRLRSRGVAFDEDDLEECYAQAWHGLYAELLEGRAIENPTGWLVEVCFRRALDEARKPARRALLSGAEHDGAARDFAESSASVEPDLAGALDDRQRLRHAFEGLRGSLSARERQAASLCYLQGLSRAEAAAQMGVTEARMRKLMEGRGPERPGVAAKMNELVRTIGGGGWCEQQGSLMRALAFGILDPAGERYQLAQLHRRECPACRAYVLSLRGLAAVLPPLPLPWASGAVGFGGGAAAGGGAGSSAGAGAGTGAGGAGAGTGVGAGAGSGGGLFAGGSLAAKLAAGCLVVAGVGGGCVAVVGAGHAHSHRRAGGEDVVSGGVSSSTSQDVSLAGGLPALRALRPASHAASARASLRRRRTQRRSSPTASAATAALRAQHELGFERAPAPRLPAAPATPGARLPPSSSSSAGQAAAAGGPGSAAHEFGIE
jgi:DNA-directed RNA polymerase specialized sigma24 family protein